MGELRWKGRINIKVNGETYEEARGKMDRLLKRAGIRGDRA